MNRRHLLRACRSTCLCTWLCLFLAAPTVLWAENPPQPKPQGPAANAKAELVPRVRADVKKVGSTSITVLPEPPRMSAKQNPQEKPPTKPPAPRERTLVVDKDTQVFVGVIADEREGPDGKKIRNTRFTRGEFSDVKAGQKVLLQISREHADRINILPTEAREGTILRGG